VTIHGGSSSLTLNIYDQGDLLPDVYTLIDSGFSDKQSAGISYDGLSAVNLFGSSLPNTYNILNTESAVTTTVNSANPADVITVNTTHGAAGPISLTVNAAPNNNGSPQQIAVLGTPAGVSTTINGKAPHDAIAVGSPTTGLDAIQGPVSVNGQGGWFGVLDILDQAVSTGRSYAFTSNSLAWGNSAAQINFSFLVEVVLEGASGGDTVTMNSMPTSFALVLHGGNLQPSQANTLIGPDTPNTWFFDGATDAVGTLNSYLTFEFFTRVVGGAAQDNFVFGDGQSTRATLDGGGGQNWLDYSAYTSPVQVNLTPGTQPHPPGTPAPPTGLATGVEGGVQNIQNVIGSLTAANTLTGNSQSPIGGILIGGNGNDVLTAGLGRTILVGGGGADVLVGGGADDILIGGYTDYDHRQTAQAINEASWLAIVAVWQSPDKYLTRLTAIRHGVGAGGWHLIWGTHGTVHDDGAANVLQGDASGSPGDLDWFFRGRRDVFAVLPERGEHINNS
jgi:hypothetical protein